MRHGVDWFVQNINCLTAWHWVEPTINRCAGMLSASTVWLNNSGIYFNISIKYNCQRRTGSPLRPPSALPQHRKQCSTNYKMALTGSSFKILQLYSDKYCYTWGKPLYYKEVGTQHVATNSLLVSYSIISDAKALFPVIYGGRGGVEITDFQSDMLN